MRKKISYIAIMIVAIILVLLYGNKSNAKCPDDYPDSDIGSEEYQKDFDKWTNNFYDHNPDASLSDWSEARYRFWVDNNCVEAIKRYEEAKNSPEKVKLIRDVIKQTYEEQ